MQTAKFIIVKVLEQEWKFFLGFGRNKENLGKPITKI